MKKTAVVLGLGVSGKASMRFLLKKGYQVVGVDKKNLSEDPFFHSLSSDAKVMMEKDFIPDLCISLLVVSSGISFAHPIVKWALDQKIEIKGELELGFENSAQIAVAITGTNGKTTVTLLVEHILRSSGKKAKAIGNVGFSATEYFLQSDPDEILVVELSSYQLETLQSPLFDAAVLLNITPDHLDRYESFQDYAKAKFRMQDCVKEGGDFFVHEQVVQDFPHLIKKPFSVLEPGEGLSLQEMAEHDRLNIMAAWALCQKLGVRLEEFTQGLQTFIKPSHRIELIRNLRNVSYYDDSKGTNIDATVQAVKTMKGPVVLIAGGVDKGSSYLAWKETFSGKVKQIFVIGEAANKIYSELSLFFNVKIVDSLERAVQEAFEVALEGDSVLLSPGCASFDMFKDYVHRGKEFQKFVSLLAEGDEK